MASTRDLIRRYGEVGTNEPRHDKIQIVQELEAQLDPQGIAFLAAIIATENEYDLARIEALKAVQIAGFDGDLDRSVVAEAIIEAVADPDLLVQQWACIAASSFVDLPGVHAKIASTLRDASADLDVRHNCLFALERLGPHSDNLALLRSLAHDPEIGIHVRRVLEAWKARQP